MNQGTRNIAGRTFEVAGALLYMLDEGENQVSDGYHEFTRLSDKLWIAQLGALSYLLTDDGLVVSAGYHSITETETGFDGMIGSRRWKLDHDGMILPDQGEDPEVVYHAFGNYSRDEERRP